MSVQSGGNIPCVKKITHWTQKIYDLTATKQDGEGYSNQYDKIICVLREKKHLCLFCV